MRISDWSSDVCSSDLIDIDREIEEVGNPRHELAVGEQVARLQHVDALEDQDVRPVDDRELVGQDVKGQVRIARRLDVGLARLDGGEEAQQRADVVAFRKALSLHQVLAPQNRIGMQKSVGGDEV